MKDILSFLRSQVVDKFFELANAGTRKHSFEDPQAKLVVDSSFLGQNIDQVVEWAQKYSGSESTPHHLIVLDEETAGDEETCLLISLRNIPDLKGEGLEQHYQILRADFESSVINLMTKEMAVGGDEMLEGDYEGFDGVLRDTVREEWERRYYGSGS